LAISSPEYFAETSINLYPNPVSDILYVNTNSFNEFEFDILDLNGRIVSSGRSSETISFSDLQQGMYFVRINLNNNIITRKVIVNR